MVMGSTSVLASVVENAVMRSGKCSNSTRGRKKDAERGRDRRGEVTVGETAAQLLLFFEEGSLCTLWRRVACMLVENTSWTLENTVLT
ncbi:hypothetical protein R1flu_007860 [Riccia fluitans]|uniref:Uncharacterized protein n=1 Tax=Riccia fluitans TaxID=41844 RepID=A0ABD1Z0L5_9MARC